MDKKKKAMPVKTRMSKLSELEKKLAEIEKELKEITGDDPVLRELKEIKKRLDEIQIRPIYYYPYPYMWPYPWRYTWTSGTSLQNNDVTSISWTIPQVSNQSYPNTSTSYKFSSISPPSTSDLEP